MMSLQQWKDRLTWIFRRKQAEEDLDEEIRAHLAIAEHQRLQAGETAEAARAAARRDFGNELLVKEVTRDVWTRRWLGDLFRDLGYGARVLRRNPGFAAVAILNTGPRHRLQHGNVLHHQLGAASSTSLSRFW